VATNWACVASGIQAWLRNSSSRSRQDFVIPFALEVIATDIGGCSNQTDDHLVLVRRWPSQLLAMESSSTPRTTRPVMPRV